MHAVDNLRGNDRPTGEHSSPARTLATAVAVGQEAPLAAAAAAAAADDVVFSLVLRLYTGQQQHRESLLGQRKQQRRLSKNDPTTNSYGASLALPTGSASTAVAGRRDPPLSSSLAAVVSLAVGDAGNDAVGFSDEESEGLDSDEDNGHGDGWEDSAAAAVRKLEDARSVYPREVCVCS